ncbi:unnamed protein product [Ectocarpus sp. 4 AP-2014]|uniref:EsV-1-3 n=1 Tax=Ectocarpus siliculosus virus 1 (isolate New Zealand/Kaikoura/1988) TaxID=654926 RepID=Q8QNQ6_ESV1K|nr:EsV-1-3 [Ectocarpus siliculosus virus 1]AAK14429.1 EsV-1-3 [Ectocarpus siliculosus virus 1]
MDPLTARLMSRSGLSAAGRPPAHSTPMIKAGIGLNPSKPLLPPVHNLRMIYLKEPLTDAEKDLHAARVALKLLETADNDVNRKALYKAMAKLQGKEAQYFATRYIGRGKPQILRGWKTHYFSVKVGELLHKSVMRHTSTHQDAIDAADGTYYAAEDLRDMDTEALKPNPQPKAWFDAGRTDIETQIASIEGVILNKTTMDVHDIASLNDSLQDAKNILRLAKLVDNVREVPYDML